MDFEEKNITILGLSISGTAVARYAKEMGANVIISEFKPENEENKAEIEELRKLGILVEMGGHNEETIKNAGLIITSPGIPPRASVFELAKKYDKEVISELDFAYLNTDKQFITITGTNGKTTTTKLVSEILENAGIKAPVSGNIGVPPTSLLNDEVDYFITEISSYQIEYSKYLRPFISCFINYTPDHVDWHGSVEKYLEAKKSHFEGVNAPCYAVLNFEDENVKSLRATTPSKILGLGVKNLDICVFKEAGKVYYKNMEEVEEVFELSEAKIFGEHNHQNIMTAIAVAKLLNVSNKVIQETLKEFNPPEHRIEYTATIDGIRYFNDSKGTNCDATICALKAFENKVVLIAGGRDKHTDLTEFCQYVKEKASNVILIGEATERFNDELVKNGYTNIYKEKTLEDAIDRATELKAGDVLFSPACASFDMFKNYEERGKAFKNYVQSKNF